MSASRLVVVLPLLLISVALLGLAVFQVAIVFDAIARFGAAEAWPKMLERALEFAIPGAIFGAIAVIWIRRR